MSTSGTKFFGMLSEPLWQVKQRMRVRYVRVVIEKQPWGL